MELGPIFEIERDILYIRGERKGELKAKVETARNLKIMGLSVADIAKGTGLSIDEIKSL